MYGLMLGIEYVGIGMLVLEIIYVIRQKSSYMQNLMLILLISLLLNFTGYLLELTSRDQKSALLGVKLAYLGKPYIVLSIFFFVMALCKIRVPLILKNIQIGFQLLITILVLTCDHHHLYYSSIGYTTIGDYSHLVLRHGVFYYLYILVVCMYFVAIVAIGTHKMRNTKDRLTKRQVMLCLIMAGISLVSLILFLTGWTDGFDSTLLAYFICVQMLVVLMFRYELFNTLSLAKEEATDRMSEAVIVFDNDDEILYLNRNGELLRQYIEKKMGNVAEVLAKLDTEKEHLIVLNGYIFKGDRSDYSENPNMMNSVYHISCRETVKNNRSYGKTYVVTDETDSFYYTERLQAEVKGKTKEIVRMQRSIIGSFATMIEARDGITGLHIKNTGSFVRVLVRAMQKDARYREVITDEYAEMVSEAAYLHDIGKIAVPDYVLQKPGKLTDEEFAIMKRHPEEGAKIILDTLGALENDEYVTIAYDMARYHHEKYAGRGYPCNLHGEEIPLSARIMAICDVYEALRSKRHYKEGFSVEKSVAIIQENRGIQFDPYITDIFLEHIDEMEAVFTQNS